MTVQMTEKLGKLQRQVQYTVIIIRSPQNSIGTHLSAYTTEPYFRTLIVSLLKNPLKEPHNYHLGPYISVSHDLTTGPPKPLRA